ncbi:MAG: PhoH family protein [Candidatus Latescibacteria bacterium]|nr:PhoH family protein [Candidatus Latescibacterota bacterium]
MSTETTELIYPTSTNYLDLFGCGDRNIRAVEDRYGVQVVCRDGAVKITGEKISAKKAAKIVKEMDALISSGTHIDEHTLSSALDYLESGGSNGPVGFDTVILNAKGRQIKPRSLGQCLYLNAMMENDIVFSIGPAGTGKTYLAVAMAVSALINRAVQKIILCRPAVEAGESLGFLPGDLKDKVEPYFRPLYDALIDTLGFEKLQKLQDQGIVEVAPLAYMRGRTLANASIILDEAQNTTSRQMKMLLTRLGVNSKLVVTGDVTQIDLPHNSKSGLTEIEPILADIKGVAFITLTSRDVVRHRLVQDIIKAYSKHESTNTFNNNQNNHTQREQSP